MIDKVVLMNTYSDEDYEKITHGCNNYGLLVLEEALRDHVIVELLPENETALEDIREEVKAVGSDNSVFGIQVLTWQYKKAARLSRIIREQFPNAKIAYGGPHCRDDVIELPLREGHADLVFQGNGQNFVEWVGGKKPQDIKGVYWIEDGEFKGRGRSGFPESDIIPVKYAYQDLKNGKRAALISLLIRDICSNWCDYCSIFKQDNGVTVDKVIKSLSPIIEGSVMGRLSMEDSNLFDPQQREFYGPIFDELRERKFIAIKGGFLDVSHLANKTDYKDLLNFVDRHFFTGFAVGVDCVTEESSINMGRRYKGKIRDQAKLDAEKVGLERFIKDLNRLASSGKGFSNYDVALMYIYDPLSGRESATKLMEHMQYFMGMSNENVKVSAKIHLLYPNPGTKLRKRNIGIINPTQYVLGESEVWIGVGDNERILYNMLDIMVPQLGTYEGIVNPRNVDYLLRLVDAAYSRDITKVPDRFNEVCQTMIRDLRKGYK